MPIATDPEEYRRLSTEIANPMDLDPEYTRISADAAYWGRKKAEAKKALGEAKVALDEAAVEVKRIEGLLYMEKREEGMGEDSKGKPKPPTEAAINSEVVQDKRYTQARAEVNDAQLAVVDTQHEFDQMWATFDAVMVKKEMLVSMGADRRAELNSDPALRRQARGQREGESQEGNW